MSYIYEMHRALLKIQYVLPKDHYCSEIRTVMENNKPFDLSNLSMRYEVSIYKSWFEENENQIVDDVMHFAHAKMLDDLIEDCRKWSIQVRGKDEQSIVDKMTNP